MAVKRVSVPDVGEISLYKRRGLKSIRLSIRSDGTIRVSLPTHVPYQAALQFVRSKQDWILEHQTIKDVHILENAQAVGKHHTLRFMVSFTADGVRSRLKGSEISVIHPASLSPTDPVVQQVAEKACIRALRDEAESLLPARVADIALRTGFTYTSVLIKKLKGRWGSCDQHHNIVLNLYLMQLPWELIDYVILHELVHTEQLHHGPDFWGTFEQHLPAAKQLRRRMRQYQPNLLTTHEL
jgi:predicted metal-dependent hydrolase